MLGELGKEMPVFPWSSRYSLLRTVTVRTLHLPLVLAGGQQYVMCLLLARLEEGASQFLLLLLILGYSPFAFLLAVSFCNFH